MKATPDWAHDQTITVFNDDDSPYEGVVQLLRRCIGFGEENAHAWARHIDRNGSAKLGPWSPAIAASIYAEMKDLAAVYGCASLRIVLEGQEETTSQKPKAVARRARQVLTEHFSDWTIESLIVVKREFPVYLRIDVQRAIEATTQDAQRIGVHSQNRYDATDLASLLSQRDREKYVGALQFDDFDIGELEPIRLATNCLSLLVRNGTPIALWVNVRGDAGDMPLLSVEIAAPPGELAAVLVAEMLDSAESAVAAGRSYRGKVLSLEASETFRGLSATALTVHYRADVSASDLILPTRVVSALERHVVEFAANRAALKKLGQPGRKGLLLYGPPGTGKTHSIRYLARRLEDHTTFLVTAEQVGLIPVYFKLARLFAPSLIVIEDADLIARQREDMSSACDEVMLNRLLNEMDGLRQDADIFVIMTTNRPETLEAALVQRPGRIDHAIEVPLPDADCRQRLIRLYAKGLEIGAAAMGSLVQRTEGVSAAFIKELARRLALESIRAGRAGNIEEGDLAQVLEEMLAERHGLNLRLLGGAAAA